jgi:hypothetical protein
MGGNVVTTAECHTIRLLRSWAWTVDAIAVRTERQKSTIIKHYKQDCNHRYDSSMAMQTRTKNRLPELDGPDMSMGHMWTRNGFKKV